jgi:mannosyltransferase OCH1-like enzyme
METTRARPRRVPMIPRMLHQVWVGRLPLPEEFARYGESWRRHHPDWEMRFWTDENLPDDLIRPEAYERLRKPAERSDIIRLEVLFRFGGVYVDTDCECLRPFDPLLQEGVDLFTGDLGGTAKVNTAVIGSVPGHPLLERALRELRPVTEYGLDQGGTGPRFLSGVLREHPDQVMLYPREFFQPSTDAERERAYSIHHMSMTWRDPEEWRAAEEEIHRRFQAARERIKYLEALMGLHGPAAGSRAWRAGIAAWARSRFGERLGRRRRRPTTGDESGPDLVR